MDLFVHQHLLGSCSFIHDIDFSYHTDGPLPLLIPVPSQLQPVRCRQVLVSRYHAKNDSLGVTAIPLSHLCCDSLHVFLPLHVNSSNARQIDNGEVRTVTRINSQFDRVIDDLPPLSRHIIS